MTDDTNTTGPRSAAKRATTATRRRANLSELSTWDADDDTADLGRAAPPNPQDENRPPTRPRQSRLDPAILERHATGTATDGNEAEDTDEEGAPRLTVSPTACLILILILTAALAASLTMLVLQGRALTRVAEGTLEGGGVGIPEPASPTAASAQPATPAPTAHEASGGAAEAPASSATPAASTAPAAPTAPAAEDTGLVNINTATSDQLQTVKGIGPVTAQKIIDYREAHGPYRSVDDLLNVSGIGAKTLAKIRAGLTV